jgi:hypothetical protein
MLLPLIHMLMITHYASRFSTAKSVILEDNVFFLRLENIRCMQ